MSTRVIQDSEASTWTLDHSPETKRLAIVIAISIVAVLPILIFGIPSNRDLSNHFRFALPFCDAIASRDFYPGWLAETNAGYGDPSFRFYPPGLYYLLAAFRLLTGNWYVSTLLTFTVVSIVAGLGMYYWSKTLLPASTAVLASLFYALAPYHVNQLFQAVMLADWAGSAVLPFAFAFVERICAHGRRRDVAGLALSFALLVLTHLPLTVIGAFGLLVYSLVRLRQNDQPRLHTLAKLAASAVIGLCASSIYWVTMASELRWIGMNEVQHDSSVDYRFNFVLSTFSPDYLNVWWMNILLLLTVLLFAPAILLLRRTAAVQRRSVQVVIVLALFGLFMSLPLSRPLWMLLRVLQETQFPWRWFALFSMAGAMVAAAAVSQLWYLRGASARVVRMLFVGAMLISIAFTLSHTVREAVYLQRAKFESTLASVRGSESINYWLPIWASPNPRQMNDPVEAGNRVVTVNSWANEHRSFSVQAGEPTEARVRTFYYPHWTATSNNRILTTRPDKDGALLISLPQEGGSVSLDFREPRRTQISRGVSLAGFILIGALLVPTLRRRKQ